MENYFETKIRCIIIINNNIAVIKKMTARAKKQAHQISVS